MPSVYLPKASMPDHYDIVMPFGNFRLALSEHEGDDTRYLHGIDICTFQGQTITASQVRQVFSERDRLSDLDSARVTAANAARDAQLADRSSNAQRQREYAALAHRQKLLGRIAWADAELDRVRLTLAMAEQRAQSERGRLTTIKGNAERELEELP